MEGFKHGRKTIDEVEVSVSKDKAVSTQAEAIAEAFVTVAATGAAKKGMPIAVPVARTKGLVTVIVYKGRKLSAKEVADRNFKNFMSLSSRGGHYVVLDDGSYLCSSIFVLAFIVLSC